MLETCNNSQTLELSLSGEAFPYYGKVLNALNPGYRISQIAREHHMNTAVSIRDPEMC